MTGQKPMRRYRLSAEGPSLDGRTEHQLIDTFDDLFAAVSEIGRLFRIGAQIAGGAWLVILDEHTNATFDKDGEPIAASAAA